MIDRAAISTPIAGDEPSGPWLRREGTHAAVKEAMKSDPGDPDYGIPRKDADWSLVTSLCTDALTKTSKDFYLAHCLMEALVRNHGAKGLAEGLWVIAELHERFWDDFHPRPRDGDIEARVNQLELMLREWSRILGAMPVSPSSASESLTVFQWKDAGADEKDATIRSASWESIDQSVTAMQQAEAEIKRFDDLVDTTYANMAPSLGEVKETLDDAARIFRNMLSEKGPSPHVERAQQVLNQTSCSFLDAEWLAERIKGGLSFSRLLNSAEAATADAAQGKQPEEGWPALLDRVWGEDATYERTTEDAEVPVAAAPVAAAPGAGSAQMPAQMPAQMTVPAGAGGAGAVIGACHAWRLADPGEPQPYVLLRELRFSELSNEAPPAGVRDQCQSLFAGEKWADLVELCESTLESSSCAGWLDLHRYSAAAMGRAGAPFGPVRRAVITRIAALMVGKGSLGEAELSDGKPAADEITQNWLKAEVAKAAPAGGPVVAAGEDDAFQEAVGVLEGDGLEAAVQQLHAAAAGANGLRERALRRRDLGELCLKAERPEYAVAILESLRDDLHEQGLGTQGLRHWEGTDFLGRTLESLYKSYNLLQAAQPAEEWAARIRSVADELADVDLARRIRLEAAGS